MQTLLSALEEKAQSMDVQIRKAKPMQETDVAWKRMKSLVDGLPVNLDEITGKIVECKNVQKSYHGKCNFQGKCKLSTVNVQAFLEQEPHTLMILAYVCPQHEYKSLSYVAINNARRTVYIRELVKNHKPQEA